MPRARPGSSPVRQPAVQSRSYDQEVANIGLGVKKASPASKTLVVSLANGSAGSGYIYSDDAYHHLTFQVIGSRVKPGFAEKGIISHAVDLVKRSAQPAPSAQ